MLTDLDNKTFRLYNADHSLKKETTLATINHELSACYLQSMFYFTSRFVNGDEKIELFVCWKCDGVYYLYLYDEDGNVIYNFGAVAEDYMYGISEVEDCFYETESGYKMIVIVEEYVNYDVYSFGGSSTPSAALKAEKLGQAFPNPVNSVLTIPCKTNKKESLVTIYDLEGKVIEKRKIKTGDDDIQINVSGYRPGVYMYEIGNISQKFIVE